MSFTIANPGREDAAIAMKWLGHEQDGRSGREFAYVVPAGQTYSPGTADWEALFSEDWGAVLVSSSSPSIVVQSETASYRTKLVLANPTDIAVLAVVRLYAAEGRLIGSHEVSLPPLGMAQISRVASALGAPYLELGRISVSTPTPGGLVAAYASVIDNESNDPRTVLPR